MCIVSILPGATEILYEVLCGKPFGWLRTPIEIKELILASPGRIT
jgi:hypothetical protein